jgi:hypothetical protein
MMLVILLFVRHNIIKNYKSIAIVLLIVVHVSYKKSFLIGCELLFHECIAKHAEKEINQLRFSTSLILHLLSNVTLLQPL